jgi:predicted amidohydrolase
VKESGATAVAAVQLSSGSDVKSNVDGAIELIQEAADRGAAYIQLPEYFNYLGPVKRYAQVAEAIPGPTTIRLGEIAASRHVTIHVGSMLERSGDETKCFNTSVVIGPTGEVVARYRKIHLFDIDVPGASTLRESDDIAPGEHMVVADLAGFRLGLSVCFDLRFAELYRALAVNGATVLAIPSAFNAVTGSAHWEVLVRARAIENHAYVVAAAQVGLTAEGIATYGHSMIVGPWGDVLVESEKSGPDVLVASIDVDEVLRRRSQIAVLELRRADLYDRDVDVEGEA